MWTVYSHKNKVNGKVYIGITGKKPEYRWGKDGNGYRRGVFRSAIDKYGWGGFEHTILFEFPTKQEAELKEIELIALYNSTNPQNGYNRAVGGGVNVGFEIPHDTRLKMSIAHKNIHFHHAQSSKDKISKYQRGKTVSLETRERIRTGHIKSHGRGVVQFTPDGSFVKKWDSISDAASYLDSSRKCIYDCCLGKQKTTHGYKFSFLEDYSGVTPRTEPLR